MARVLSIQDQNSAREHKFEPHPYDRGQVYRLLRRYKWIILLLLEPDSNPLSQNGKVVRIPHKIMHHVASLVAVVLL